MDEQRVPERRSAGRLGRAASRPVTLVMNVAAGRGGRWRCRRVAQAFRREGVAVDLVEMEPGRVVEAVRTASREELIVAVAGGDGTLQAAANELAGTTAVLLPVPTGTFNHFARRMGVTNVRAAARAAAGGRIERVAIGELEGRVFLNTASCGAYAHVIRYRERLRRWLGKWPAAAVATALVLWRLPLLKVSVDVGDRRLRLRTPLVWVGLGRGSFPFSHLARRGSAADVLEVIVVRPWGRWSTARLLFSVYAMAATRRDVLSDPRLEVFHVTRARLEAPGMVDITLDGEVGRVAPPLEIQIRKGALRVAVPPDFGG